MFGIRTNPVLIQWFQTVNLHLEVFALGCIFGLTGATLLDLGDIYVTSPKVVSYIITTRGIGSIVFCLLAGSIYRYMNIQHVMTISVLGAGICLALTPLLGNLTFCHIVTFILGGCIGLLETGSNGWIIGLWREKSGTVFQFYNFCFGLGGVLAPFIAEPFLSKVHSRSVNETSIIDSVSFASHGVVGNSSSSDNTGDVLVDILPYTADTRVYIAYLLLGGLFIVITVTMIISYILDTKNVSPGDSASSDSTCSRKWELTMVVVFCMYILTIVTLEQTYVSMLAVYVVENDQLSFSKSDSAYVSAVFWIFFTLARVVSTLASLHVRPSRMLFVCHGLCILGAAWLVATGGWSSISVWICSGLMGAGVSPMFATALSHVMQYVLLSHTYMSFVMLCTCWGSMMPPLLVGPYIEENPVALLYVNMALSTLAVILMAALLLLVRGKQMRPSMIRKCI